MTGVVTAVRIVRQIGQLTSKYKYLDINQKFVRKYVPPGYRKQAEFIIDTAVGGGILYQIVDGIYNAFQTPKRTAPYNRQTRNYMERPGNRRFRSYQQNPRYCRPTRFKKSEYRSRYR